MKVAILGGAGLTGQCAVRALAETKDVIEGIVDDPDENMASSVSDLHGRGKFHAARVDLRDVTKTADLIRGCDIVVSGAQYYFNLEAMAAALKARTHYLDFGGLYHMTLKQLKLDGEFRSRNLLALIGMGNPRVHKRPGQKGRRFPRRGGLGSDQGWDQGSDKGPSSVSGHMVPRHLTGRTDYGCTPSSKTGG